MKKQLYSTPEIRVRGLEMERLLDSGSITGINDGGSGDDGPGYGGEGNGPAYAPEFRNIWDD
ncbi:MAG: hypothetical protein IKX17_01420 [Prevotella sp.]|nr:hypothetical protein [Prevotella sp.]